MKDEKIAEIQEELSSALGLVKDIDGDLKIEAFKYVLKRLLGEFESTPLIPNVDVEHGRTVGQENEEEPTTFYERVSKETGIDIEILEALIGYDENKNTFALKFSFTKGKEAEKQIEAALVYLTLKKYGLEEQSGDSRELIELLENLKIGSISNFSTHMSNKGSYFTVNGVKGSPNKTYIITKFGLQKGVELLKSRAEAMS